MHGNFKAEKLAPASEEAGSRKPEAAESLLAHRLAAMLGAVYAGQSLDRGKLASQFGVTERTVYRDLQRLAPYIELQADGNYHLAPRFNPHLPTQALTTLTALVGAQGLFPSSAPSFLLPVVQTPEQVNFTVKGPAYESQPSQQAAGLAWSTFELADQSIRNRSRCQFLYAQRLRTVEPYRLINKNGIWYLAAVEVGVNQLKTFSVGRMGDFRLVPEPFVRDTEIVQRIQENDDIWLGESSISITLRVSSDVVNYFLRRPLLPRQENIEECADGSWHIRTTVVHINQIMPLIQHWIPNVWILEPDWVAALLQEKLRTYLISIQKNLSEFDLIFKRSTTGN